MQERSEKEKEVRHQAREERTEIIKEWTKLEEQRKMQNTARVLRYKEAVILWEREKAKVKAAGRKFGQRKPLRGKLVGLIPKPKLTLPVGASSNEKDVNNDDSEGSDNDADDF